MMNGKALGAVASLFLATLILGSCGGRGVAGVGGGTTGGDPFARGPMTGRVELGEITRGRAEHTYTIRTPIGEAVVDPGGNYSVRGFVNSPTPAMLLDEAGELRSFAYIERTGTILNNGLVAKSLALLAAKAHSFSPELRQRFWENLGTAPEVDALRANLVALGGHLNGDPTEVRDATNLHIGAMVTRLSTEASRMRIEPGAGQSGVEVLQQGLNDIIAVNHFRRRAHAFVERIGVTMEGGVNEPRQDAVTDFSIDPISNPASLNGLLADIGTMMGDGNSAFSGNVAWVPTKTEPLHLDLVPSNAVGTKYRVVVVGPGLPTTQVSSLTPQMQDMLDNKILDTVILDFVIPSLISVSGPLLANYGEGKSEKMQQAIAAVTLIVKDGVGAMLAEPGVRSKLEAGDFPGAAHDIVSLFMTSELYSEMRNRAFFKFIMTFAESADEEVVNKFIGSIGKLLGEIDLVLQGADFAMIGAHIAQSTTFEEFVIDVTKARVKLSPQASLISPLNEVTLQATVPDATGEEAPLITYRFKLLNTGGVTLKHPVTGENNIELGSSNGAMIVKSTSHQTGAFRVEAEAIVDRPGTQDDVSLGKAEVTVTVINDKAVLRPAMASIRPGGTQTLTCTINNPRPNGQYMLRWSGTNTAGSIPASGELTSNRSIVYTAGNGTGSDEVTVDVYQQGESGLVRIGTSKSGIRVEEEPTILPATYRRELITPYVAGAFVSFAEPARPGSYRLVGVGGNDPAYYGSSISMTGGQRILNFGVPYDLGEGTLGFGLSLGSSNNPAEYFPWFDGRFGGFSFYVEVTR